MMKKKRFHLTTFQTIILGFAAIILLGALLLLLPISAKSGQRTSFLDALFTSVSAVCVTGLVVVDTATHWSGFGQAVLLFLIQIGGLGIVTIAASMALLFRRKITLMQRTTMQEAVAAQKVGSIVRLTIFILTVTFSAETIGACLLLPVFCVDFGAKGIWLAVFHSVSAFCNAGFDILGTPDTPYPSLSAYRSNPLLNITVMLLIIVGGIGFLTWDDVRTNKWRLKRYRMQSKVILTTTALLILVPAAYNFSVEFSSLPLGQRILCSLFQAVTPRTAGFSTVDLNDLSGAGRGIMIGLMLIGGSPGSTAGGMKTTTIAVLVATVLSVFERKQETQMFGRRVENSTVRNAIALLMLYLSLFVLGGMAISLAEGLPLGDCLFETASAIGTVGLSLGFTPALGVFSKLVLIFLMFLGRVGGLTFIFAALSGRKANLYKYPQEKITVG